MLGTFTGCLSSNYSSLSMLRHCYNFTLIETEAQRHLVHRSQPAKSKSYPFCTRPLHFKDSFNRPSPNFINFPTELQFGLDCLVFNQT